MDNGVSESIIIESSQVAAAYVIRKAMKKWKANKLKKEGRKRNETERHTSSSVSRSVDSSDGSGCLSFLFIIIY